MISLYLHSMGNNSAIPIIRFFSEFRDLKVFCLYQKLSLLSLFQFFFTSFLEQKLFEIAVVCCFGAAFCNGTVTLNMFVTCLVKFHDHQMHEFLQCSVLVSCSTLPCQFCFLKFVIHGKQHLLQSFMLSTAQQYKLKIQQQSMYQKSEYLLALKILKPSRCQSIETSFQITVIYQALFQSGQVSKEMRRS